MRAGESFMRVGESFMRAGESFMRAGESFMRAGESFMRAGESFMRAGESFMRAGESFMRAGESFMRASESFMRAVDEPRHAPDMQRPAYLRATSLSSGLGTVGQKPPLGLGEGRAGGLRQAAQAAFAEESARDFSRRAVGRGNNDVALPWPWRGRAREQ